MDAAEKKLPASGGVVVAGVGRDGASIVAGLTNVPASVSRVFVTGLPTKAIADLPELLLVRASDNWRGEAERRLAGARMVVAVFTMNCRERAFALELLELGKKQGAVTVAVVVEPLFAARSQWDGNSDQVVKEALRGSDAVIVAASEMHPPATLGITEALEMWNGRLVGALHGLLTAAAATDAMNADFSDLAEILSLSSRATVGCGCGEGIEEALADAARNSLALTVELETASSVLAHVVVGGQVPLDNVRRAEAALEQLFPKAAVRCGISIDEAGSDVRATIIAGKLDGDAARNATRKRTAPAESSFLVVGDPTVYDGENLDAPAYIRKDLLLPGGPPRPVPAQKTLFESKPA